MTHERLMMQSGINVSADGQSFTGIIVKPHVMPRNTSPVMLILLPGEGDREASTSDVMVVMEEGTMSDLLLDKETMTKFGIFDDTIAWTTE